MSGKSKARCTDPMHVDMRELLSERDLRYQQRFDAQNSALEAARIAIKGEVEKALTSMDARLALLNELRHGVATVEQLDAIGRRIEDLKERMDRSEGRSTGFSSSWAILIAAITIAIGVYVAFS